MSQEVLKAPVFYIKKHERNDLDLRSTVEALGFECVEKPAHPFVKTLKRFSAIVCNIPSVFS